MWLSVSPCMHTTARETGLYSELQGVVCSQEHETATQTGHRKFTHPNITCAVRTMMLRRQIHVARGTSQVRTQRSYCLLTAQRTKVGTHNALLSDNLGGPVPTHAYACSQLMVCNLKHAPQHANQATAKLHACCERLSAKTAKHQGSDCSRAPPTFIETTCQAAGT